MFETWRTWCLLIDPKRMRSLSWPYQMLVRLLRTDQVASPISEPVNSRFRSRCANQPATPQRALTVCHETADPAKLRLTFVLLYDRLSAFVAKCFHEAEQFIPVEDSKLSVTLTWLLNGQYRNGSFFEQPNGRVIHTDMQVTVT